ncbi:TonB-dependent receptor [Myxococcus xanthus DK 1622]|uniref:TonB-dependent receptor n=1 Tax=Myxococcus xanthus (strain DK1622) TaxID=246197 RepID=Q1DFM0_MYXXD|nr:MULTISPECIES: TonB-dependent receptor [Myxococcus]ABF89166.1 TonB-dependent receptor [Myxococcus xanthus DK 1622]NOJ56129.1 TonB-dependent receptor [Myxococcus xanthus]QPM79996.1 TonB-dependent receptor [Myxococcus xanthus]QVW69060.1 TonB-dependent receptor [Myxococcus xanthus DZ2]UEO04812.1 TonB-dependent receptor [Myxococcus xanthus DZ2]
MRVAFSTRTSARSVVLSRTAPLRAILAALVMTATPVFAQAPGVPGSAPAPAVDPVTQPLPPSEETQPSQPTDTATQPSGIAAPPAVGDPSTQQPGTESAPTAQQPGVTPAPTAQQPGTEPAPTAQQPGTEAAPTAQQPGVTPAPTAQQPGTEPAPTAQQPAAPADESMEGISDEAMLAESAVPPPGFTGIYGRVTDEANGEGLIEATVKVVAGAQKQVLTDLDGFYRVALPPGKYDLRVFYDVYQGRRITGVVVTKGKATKLDVALGADEGAVQEVVVEARADRRAEGALLQERKKAAAVSDAISAQEIARTPDSSASDAVKRVVSATVVDGRYVLLRGLGGRYSTTLLNGALLPSTEPDEPSVPLDIFPTSLLANLNVVKSYTPDLPGTFAGGTLLIETNSYPSEFELKPRISLAGDSETTFRERNSQAQGGFGENLGFPSGSRQLPNAIPRDSGLGMSGESSDVLEQQYRSFPNIWQARRTTALPNMGLGVSMGDTLRFGNSRLGYLASANYGHRDGVQEGTFARVDRDETGALNARDAARSTQGFETASLSGLGSVGFQLDRDNELTWFGLYTRGTDTRTFTARGSNIVRGESYESTRLQFVSRQLFFNQLRGFHRLGLLGDAELDWQANLSRVDRDEPDTRDTLYSDNLSAPSGTPTFPNQPNSGERFFAELGETSTGGSVNVTVPLSAVRLKVGGLTQVSFRDFGARRFRYLLGTTPVDRTLPPEQLFAPENLGTGIRVRENTRPDDAYDAYLGIFAGYASADVQPTDALRLVGGLRVESSTQQLTLKDPFTGASGTENRSEYMNLLPAFNAIYALTPTVNVRAGYSYTLARPTFRELAPFIYFDFVRRRNVSGNPDLLQTRIHNIDARVEWFAGENEVLAASAFYKRFQDPIERVIRNPESGDLSFENAAGANTYGLELEARASLARLTETLKAVRVGANLTLIQSDVDLGDPNVVGAQTNRNRPLQGQSPYVINLNVGYSRPESGTELTVLYNVYGRRISEVGVQGLPDIYEVPFHRVDISLTQQLGSAQLKLTAANLLNSSVTLRQESVDVQTYKPGVAFSASLGWSL